MLHCATIDVLLSLPGVGLRDSLAYVERKDQADAAGPLSVTTRLSGPAHGMAAVQSEVDETGPESPVSAGFRSY